MQKIIVHHKLKDMLIILKLYLQTLINIKEGNEVEGDRKVLKILEKDLKEFKKKVLRKED